VEADRLLSLVLIGDTLEFFSVFASFSADFNHCFMEVLTPFSVFEAEHGSLVHGLDSVRSRILMAMYLPHCS